MSDSMPPQSRQLQITGENGMSSQFGDEWCIVPCKNRVFSAAFLTQNRRKPSFLQIRICSLRTRMRPRPLMKLINRNLVRPRFLNTEFASGCTASSALSWAMSLLLHTRKTSRTRGLQPKTKPRNGDRLTDDRQDRRDSADDRHAALRGRCIRSPR